MSFDVAAEAYGRFMGVYSEPLAVLFAGELRLARGQRALDVGCGPGALTEHLVQVLGPEQVHAVDPSEPFVAAARRRLPEWTSGGPGPRTCPSTTTPSTFRRRNSSSTS